MAISTQGWINSGIGALVGSGFLTYLAGVGPSNTNFGVLTAVLTGIGIFFVGYGAVKDFVLDKIPQDASN